VRLGDHHVLLVWELVECFFDEGLTQIVNFFVGEEERDAKRVAGVVGDVLELFVHVLDVGEILPPLPHHAVVLGLQWFEFHLLLLLSLALLGLLLALGAFVFLLLVVCVQFLLLLVLFLFHGCFALPLLNALVKSQDFLLDDIQLVQHGVLILQLLGDLN